jgi:hypothetical protein
VYFSCEGCQPTVNVLTFAGEIENYSEYRMNTSTKHWWEILSVDTSMHNAELDNTRKAVPPSGDPQRQEVL